MTTPTTAQLVDVANAVASGLRAADGVPRGTVSIGFLQRRSLEEAGLAIVVFPRKTRTTRLTRGGLLQVDLDVNVGIFAPLVGTDKEIDEQVERLLLLSERIADHFTTHALPDRSEQLVETSTDATGDIDFDPATLVEQRQFESILTLTFRGARQPA